MTPKLWALFNLACQDTSFGTLQSQIGHIVNAGEIPKEQQEEEEQEYNR